MERRHKRTLSFMDNQVTAANSEDALQIPIHKLEKVIFKYGLKLPISKTKTMEIKWEENSNK
jgi:hypothetical protein